MTDRRPGVNKEKDTHKLTLTHKQSTKKKMACLPKIVRGNEREKYKN